METIAWAKNKLARGIEFARARPALVAVVVAILILIVLYVAWDPPGEEYLTGVWVASDDFCHKSGIDSMMITIGPPEGWINRTRKCYVIIAPNLSSQMFTVEYSRGSGLRKYKVKWHTDFEEEEIMPEKIKCEIDIMTGHMLLTEDKTVYGEFYKSLDTTALVKSAVDDEEDERD